MIYHMLDSLWFNINLMIYMNKVQYVYFVIIGNGILIDLTINWTQWTILINDIDFTVK